MDSLNPYAAPSTEIAYAVQAAPAGLRLRRALGIILGCGCAGALLGSLLGALIGGLLPDYYRAVFRNPGLDAFQVGIGLGLTQGLGIGLALGTIVLVAMAISIRRRH